MKHIVIIGGGISGLSLLHYLSIKYYYRQDVDIRLLEKKDETGGCIHSVAQNGFLFEAGPNGFLSTKRKVQALRLVTELGLTDALLPANENAAIRYISLKHKLHICPRNFKQLRETKLLTFFEKIRALADIFIPKGNNTLESVFSFAERRLGRRMAEIFFDSAVTGVYAGESSQMNMKEAFPQVYEAEQKCGSLLRGFPRMLGKPSKAEKPPQLFSFKRGMQEIIHALQKRFSDKISTKVSVEEIVRQGEQFVIHTDNLQYTADEVFVCTPAYEAGRLLKNIDEEFPVFLKQINYASLAVVGLAYEKSRLQDFPEGFGYLVPREEKSPVLGVLLENNVFPERSPEKYCLLRMMIGGVRHPQAVGLSRSEIVARAKDELRKTLGITEEPSEVFYSPWNKAIPQYDRSYVLVKESINGLLEKHPRLHLAANYRGGVSVSDCIENAYQTAQKSSL